MRLGVGGKLVGLAVGGMGLAFLGLSVWEASYRAGWVGWDEDLRKARWDAVAEVVRLTMPPHDRLLVGLHARPPVTWLGLNTPVGRVEDRFVQNPVMEGSCAVVGSSGNLTGWGQGKEIDSHDQVIRMNFAPTTGYADDVGSRTTLMLLGGIFVQILVHPHRGYGEYLSIREAPVGSDYLFINRNGFLGIISRLERGASLGFPLDPERTRFLSHEAWGIMHAFYTKAGISAGLRGIILASLLCDEVSVYGFGMDPSGRWDYYYKPTRKGHDVHGEARVIQKLSQFPFLTYYPGNVNRTQQRGPHTAQVGRDSGAAEPNSPGGPVF